MSWYKCRMCNNRGHFNDSLIGYYYEDIVCPLCLRKLPEEEKVEVLKEIAEKVAIAQKECENKAPYNER